MSIPGFNKSKTDPDVLGAAIVDSNNKLWDKKKIFFLMLQQFLMCDFLTGK
jgi:hypothetical protein